MGLEQLSLTPNPLYGEADAVINGVDSRPPSADGGDDGVKTPRLPRWTRQEILVLIQGKKVAENRVRRGRTVGTAFGSGQVEPKWASVSSYCKRHGVNRGPVQCRKRWSNLAGDYKKIKEWESQIREETDSFWVMRNDLRRERKLPGFFDREVYDILDSGSGPLPTTGLALALGPSPASEEGAEPEAIFDSEKTADDGLFSDFEQDKTSKEAVSLPNEDPIGTAKTPISAPKPISEQQCHPDLRGSGGQESTSRDEQERQKRRRFAASDGDGEGNGEEEGVVKLIDALDKNGKMLRAQLETQNINFQLDREQRKHQSDSLVAVLNKLADALGRIADKL